MSDTVEISTAVLFWIILGSSVTGAVIAWLAVWEYWRRFANEQVRAARAEYISDQTELRNARIVQQVHEGITLEKMREL